MQDAKFGICILDGIRRIIIHLDPPIPVPLAFLLLSVSVTSKLNIIIGAC